MFVRSDTFSPSVKKRCKKLNVNGTALQRKEEEEEIFATQSCQAKTQFYLEYDIVAGA